MPTTRKQAKKSQIIKNCQTPEQGCLKWLNQCQNTSTPKNSNAASEPSKTSSELETTVENQNSSNEIYDNSLSREDIIKQCLEMTLEEFNDQTNVRELIRDHFRKRNYTERQISLTLDIYVQRSYFSYKRHPEKLRQTRYDNLKIKLPPGSLASIGSTKRKAETSDERLKVKCRRSNEQKKKHQSSDIVADSMEEAPRPKIRASAARRRLRDSSTSMEGKDQITAETESSIASKSNVTAIPKSEKTAKSSKGRTNVKTRDTSKTNGSSNNLVGNLEERNKNLTNGTNTERRPGPKIRASAARKRLRDSSSSMEGKDQITAETESSIASKSNVTAIPKSEKTAKSSERKTNVKTSDTSKTNGSNNNFQPEIRTSVAKRRLRNPSTGMEGKDQITAETESSIASKSNITAIPQREKTAELSKGKTNVETNDTSKTNGSTNNLVGNLEERNKNQTNDTITERRPRPKIRASVARKRLRDSSSSMEGKEQITAETESSTASKSNVTAIPQSQKISKRSEGKTNVETSNTSKTNGSDHNSARILEECSKNPTNAAIVEKRRRGRIPSKAATKRRRALSSGSESGNDQTTSIAKEKTSNIPQPIDNPNTECRQSLSPISPVPSSSQNDDKSICQLTLKEFCQITNINELFRITTAQLHMGKGKFEKVDEYAAEMYRHFLELLNSRREQSDPDKTDAGVSKINETTTEARTDHASKCSTNKPNNGDSAGQKNIVPIEENPLGSTKRVCLSISRSNTVNKTSCRTHQNDEGAVKPHDFVETASEDDIRWNPDTSSHSSSTSLDSVGTVIRKSTPTKENTMKIFEHSCAKMSVQSIDYNQQDEIEIPDSDSDVEIQTMVDYLSSDDVEIIFDYEDGNNLRTTRNVSNTEQSLLKEMLNVSEDDIMSPCFSPVLGAPSRSEVIDDNSNPTPPSHQCNNNESLATIQPNESLEKNINSPKSCETLSCNNDTRNSAVENEKTSEILQNNFQKTGIEREKKQQCSQHRDPVEYVPKPVGETVGIETAEHDRETLSEEFRNSDSGSRGNDRESSTNIITTLSTPPNSTPSNSQLLSSDLTYVWSVNLSPRSTASANHHHEPATSTDIRQQNDALLPINREQQAIIYKPVASRNYVTVTFVELKSVSQQIRTLTYSSRVPFLERSKDLVARISIYLGRISSMEICGDSVRMLLGFSNNDWRRIVELLDAIESFEFESDKPAPEMSSIPYRVLYYLFKTLPKFNQVTLQTASKLSVDHVVCDRVQYSKPVVSLSQALKSSIREKMLKIRQSPVKLLDYNQRTEQIQSEVVNSRSADCNQLNENEILDSGDVEMKPEMNYSDYRDEVELVETTRNDSNAERNLLNPMNNVNESNITSPCVRPIWSVAPRPEVNDGVNQTPQSTQHTNNCNPSAQKIINSPKSCKTVPCNNDTRNSAQESLQKCNYQSVEIKQEKEDYSQYSDCVQYIPNPDEEIIVIETAEPNTENLFEEFCNLSSGVQNDNIECSINYATPPNSIHTNSQLLSSDLTYISTVNLPLSKTVSAKEPAVSTDIICQSEGNKQNDVELLMHHEPQAIIYRPVASRNYTTLTFVELNSISQQIRTLTYSSRVPFLERSKDLVASISIYLGRISNMEISGDSFRIVLDFSNNDWLNVIDCFELQSDKSAPERAIPYGYFLLYFLLKTLPKFNRVTQHDSTSADNQSVCVSVQYSKPVISLSQALKPCIRDKRSKMRLRSLLRNVYKK